MVAANPRLAELRENVARQERQIKAWQPTVDRYAGNVADCQATHQATRKELHKACLWVAGGIAGMAVGMCVPGANLAALVGFGCFFKGWKDSFGYLMGCRGIKRQEAMWQTQLDKSHQAINELQSLLSDARAALLAGEAEDQVRALNEGIKRSSAVFETPQEVSFGGVRLRKRG